MRAALYARVSTKDHDQNPETQLRQLREFAGEQGWQDTVEFVDHGVSGRTLNRPQWGALMKGVRRGSYKVVVVTAIDRMSRSVLDGSTMLDEFDKLGVRFVPLEQRAFDTATPFGKAAIQISLVWAELMRAELSPKIKAGQARARAAGIIIGRPRTSLTVEAAREAVEAAGGNRTHAAAALGVPRSTLNKRLKETPDA